MIDLLIMYIKASNYYGDEYEIMDKDDIKLIIATIGVSVLFLIVIAASFFTNSR